jgi:hypothetical protein
MTATMRWIGNDGRLVTFEDRRPGAKAADPAPVVTLPFTMTEVAGHEARHAAVGGLFDFKMVEARADAPDDTCLGHVLFDHSGEQWDRMRTAEMAVVLLAGGLGEKTWPPAWPPRATAFEGDERDLAELIARLELSEKQWHGLIGVAQKIVAHPCVKKLEERYALLLGMGMTLTAPMLEDGYKAVALEAANAPATREHARQVERHRKWMTDCLRAGDEYDDEQRAQQAADDLRRRSLQVAAEVERWAAPKRYNPKARRYKSAA